MTVKELKKILAKLPDNTLVCKTSGDEGVQNYESARYCPQFSILYLEPFWTRGNRTSNIDMVSRDAPQFSKFILSQINSYATCGKELVDNMNDGKMHRVQVILTEWTESFMGNKIRAHNWLSLVVDGAHKAGGQLGIGTQTVLCDFEWESIKR